MANKKIRLTFLWTDQSVMTKDFSKGISEGMTDWANKFFATYGFELDVDPPSSARTSVLKAYKYTLVKSAGVHPDPEAQDRYAPEYEKKKKRLEEMRDHEQEIATRIQTEITSVASQSAAKVAEMHAIQAELNQLPANDAAHRAEAVQRLTNAATESTALSERITLLSNASTAVLTQVGHLTQQLIDLTGTFSRKLLEPTILLRHQMTSKYLLEGIGSERRLNVVFCEYVTPTQTSGETSSSTDDVLFWQPGRSWLWPYPFLTVDLKGQTRTLAHETVHAATYDARPHPSPETVAKIVQDWSSLPPGSIFAPRMPAEWDFVMDFKKISVGRFDGADNDIMNYSIPNGSPSAYILNENDQRRLEHAPFVVP